MRIDRVTIADNKGHGVPVNDQVHPETEDGVQPIGGRLGGIAVRRGDRVSFLRNGYSVSDRDGLRVNDGGEGALTFVARLPRSEDNAATVIELDERGAGDVKIDVTGVKLARNGKFDPLDFDDGFDIDEYDDGSRLVARPFARSSLDNYEEGFDFNENNAGATATVTSYRLVNASGNAEEGIDYEEDDDFAGGGDLVTTMVGVVANENGGDGGVKIREKGVGSLVANVTGVEANRNVVSGISVREDADGSLHRRPSSVRDPEQRGARDRLRREQHRRPDRDGVEVGVVGEYAVRDPGRPAVAGRRARCS